MCPEMLLLSAFPLNVYCRRTLPTSALAKVFFPSQSELLEYFSPGMIPQGLSEASARALSILRQIAGQITVVTCLLFLCMMIPSPPIRPTHRLAPSAIPSAQNRCPRPHHPAHSTPQPTTLQPGYRACRAHRGSIPSSAILLPTQTHLHQHPPSAMGAVGNAIWRVLYCNCGG